MKYFFLTYSLLLILSALIPIFPKSSSHHLFIMDINSSLQNFLHVPMFVIWTLLLKSPRFNINRLIINEKGKIFVLGFFLGFYLNSFKFQFQVDLGLLKIFYSICWVFQLDVFYQSN